MNQAAEITVPVLEIGPGWTIEDVKTLADCDDAHAVLSERIAMVEGDLAATNINAQQGQLTDPQAHRQLTVELRLKKAALTHVQNIRARISKDERIAQQRTRESRILEVLREQEPTALERAIETAKQRWSEVFI